MIARFIEFLQMVDLELGVEDVLEIEHIFDIFWLALQFDSKQEEIVNASKADETKQTQNALQLPLAQDSKNPVEFLQPEPITPSQHSSSSHESIGTGVHFPPQLRKDLTRGGLPFQSPTVTALPESLDLIRALRPLMRRIPSRVHRTIDEEMTAQRTAELLLAQQTNWFPVLCPIPIRWLELALVIDESRSMDIWRPRIVALKHLLEQLGAFRDVRTWGLVANNENIPSIHIRTWLRKEAQMRNPEELTEPIGQRLILVVSDCVGHMWHDGRVVNILESWGHVGPVAIIQVLPPRLWSKSALGDHIAVQLQASLPGLPNAQLGYDCANSFIEKADLKRRLPMPVVTLEKEAQLKWIPEWVKAVLTAENEQTPGYLLATGAGQKKSYDTMMENQRTELSLSAEQLVRSFSATASPKARSLIGLLAAAPIINFPIIRLIQKTMLPSNLSHVAEVFLSGLIKQVSEDSMNPDAISYDFVEGIRDLILDSQPQSKSADVLRLAITHFVEQQIGQLPTMPVLLEDPRPTAESLIEEPSRSFANITTKVLRRMGGDYAALARQLEELVSTSSEEPHDDLREYLDVPDKDEPLLQKLKIEPTITEVIKMRRLSASEIENQLGHLRRYAEEVGELEEIWMGVVKHDQTSIVRHLKDIDLAALRVKIDSEIQALEKAKHRFMRSTLNIAVIGRAGQGKSRLLQSLSGLSSECIPTGTRGNCTGTRCLIIHDSQKPPHSEISFYTEREFLSEILVPFYTSLKLGKPPTSIDEFSSDRLPPLPGVLTGSAQELRKYRRLSDYKTHLDQYRSLLNTPTRNIALQVLREYIAQDDLDGRRAYFKYMAVREAKIVCSFGRDDMGSIALVDMPSFGEGSVSEEIQLVETLNEQTDLVLFVIMPGISQGTLPDADLGLYDLVTNGLNGVSVDQWLYMILNRVRSPDPFRDNYSNCLHIKEESQFNSDTGNIKAVDCIIADCSDAAEVNDIILDNVLTYLVKNAGGLDAAYLSSWQKRIANLQIYIDAELEKARIALDKISVPGTSEKDSSGIRLELERTQRQTIPPFRRVRCPYCNQGFHPGDAAIVSALTGTVLRSKPQGRVNRLISRFWIDPLNGPEPTQQMASRQCPRCLNLLPYHFEFDPNINIAIVGDTYAGKSHYIATLFQLLRSGAMSQQNANIEYRFLAKNQGIEQMYLADYYKPVFEDHYQLAATARSLQSPQIMNPLIFQLTMRDRAQAKSANNLNIITYDLAGEDIANQWEIARTGWPILEAQAIIFLVDPLSIQGVFHRLPPNLRQNISMSNRAPHEVLANVMSAFERYNRLDLGERVDIPVAIMISKSDLLDHVVPDRKEQYRSLHDIVYDGSMHVDDFSEVDQEVRNLLEYFGEGRLVHESRFFSNIGFFATSATGCSPDENGKFQEIRPRRCLDPLLWILWKLSAK